MKLYISADIEGVCGVTSWSETELNNSESSAFIIEWIKEIQKVIDVAIEAGYDDIYLKDAHDTGRNLLQEYFPQEVKLIRGWSGHPFAMVEGIDESFNAAVFIGFHSKAGSNTNPISHSMYPKIVRSLRINGELASEFLVYYYACHYAKVPVIMVIGDLGLCNEVNEVDEEILTVATKKGFGGATLNYNPISIHKDIKDKAKIAFEKSVSIKPLPQTFDIELTFVKHIDAYRASFYKDAVSDTDGFTIKYRSKDYFDILRFLAFVLG